MELLRGDCLELMGQLPPHSVDMVLCDLPYGITCNEWDIPLPLDKLWTAYRHVCKPNAAIVLFGQQPFTARLIMSNLADFKYCWVWSKHCARGFLNAKRQPLREHEDIAVFYTRQCTYNPQMKRGKLRRKGNSNKQRGCYGKYEPIDSVNDIYYPKTILDFASVTNAERIHPTEKPVALCEYLIKTYTNTGDLVLDNCMGGGSTGVASVNSDRDFIGMELNDEYFTAANRRIMEAVNAKRQGATTDG